MPVSRFEDLRVYQQGFEAAMRIFEVSKAWPKEERFALTDQIRRSSRSVCSNVAEAWRKRRYEKHFVSKLSDADMEAAETRVWLRFALECGYMDAKAFESLNDTYNTLCGGLVHMIRRPEQWCIPSNHLREDEADYTPDH